MADLLWREGWLIFSMHMDALHCFSWMYLAFLGIANVPLQRLYMESVTQFYPLIMHDTVLLNSMFPARSPTGDGSGTLPTSTDTA